MKPQHTEKILRNVNALSMEYFTVKAESMEQAKYEAENGYDYYDYLIGKSSL